jgi:hypothetical protein
MDHIDAIEIGLREAAPFHEIARKIFLTYPTKAFVGAEEQQFTVLNAIREFFDVPITAIQVAGSAKTGKSFHAQKDFVQGTSDLDVAIVDARLFSKYAETVIRVSKRFSDQSVFPMRRGRSTYREYVDYIAKGMFRPDCMPVCPERAHWHSFFGNLSTQHTNLFGSINACIYLSEGFFESKQRSVIKNYVDSKAI